MKLSRMFGTTIREAPAGSEAASHALLVRAGFIRQLGQGIFSYLPLAQRAFARVAGIIRQEMDAIGGQELCMPVVQPAEVWKTTGRWDSIGEEMVRFKDRRDRDMTLAMTHEEVVADLARTEIRSYRQLPQLVYHIQTKFRDDPRPRAGLIRVREFTMKDSYSLDADAAGLDVQYRAHYGAYFRIFGRCDLPVVAVSSDVGMMGGSEAHEFMYLTPVGEDTLVLCRACGYAANRQVASFARRPAEAEAPRPLEKVATPDCKTIDDLARFLGVPNSRTAKAVFMMAQPAAVGAPDRFVFAIIRGDMEVNETKLSNAVSARALRPATEDEIRAVGAVPGYASPIGLRRPPGSDAVQPLVVVDESITSSGNLVAGANEEGFHLLNTNVPRDYAASMVVDIAAAGEGDSCSRCGAPLAAVRGVEVGNIFKLGTRYSDAMGVNYLDAGGVEKSVVMGSYGIGLGRLLACVAEEHHDERGLRWPATVAPYDVHLLSLGPSGSPAGDAAQRAYQTLLSAGIEVLFDDRPESPGVKFADADLIGIPIRLVASARSLQAGGLEMAHRRDGSKSIVPADSLLERAKADLAAMSARIEDGIKTPSL